MLVKFLVWLPCHHCPWCFDCAVCWRGRALTSVECVFGDGILGSQPGGSSALPEGCCWFVMSEREAPLAPLNSYMREFWEKGKNKAEVRLFHKCEDTGAQMQNSGIFHSLWAQYNAIITASIWKTKSLHTECIVGSVCDVTRQQLMLSLFRGLCVENAW